jgi:hypothetical protein
MRELREFLLTLAIVAGLLCTGLVVMESIIFFPDEEIGRFTGPPSVDPELTARVLSTIEANDDFPPGEHIIDVSQEVCSWLSEQDLHALVQQPGRELTAKFDGHFWFKQVRWPWGGSGLQVGRNSEGECYGYVRRSDAIG